MIGTGLGPDARAEFLEAVAHNPPIGKISNQDENLVGLSSSSLSAFVTRVELY